MEINKKKTCPNCSQLYQLKSLTKEQHGNIPLLLLCGHSICKKCVEDLLKFAELLITCNVCKHTMDISMDKLTSLTQNELSVYDLFPVNIYLLGELALQSIEDQKENDDKENKDFYVDIKGIIENTPEPEGTCLECHGKTSQMCQQCGIIVCLKCFKKSHNNFVIFKNHVLQNIETVFQQSKCSTHEGKQLDYYCRDCLKPICMDCLVVSGTKSCKNHNVVAAQEVNKEFTMDIMKILPEVEEKLKRLTKTAHDIGDILTKEDENSTSTLTNLTNEIEQHFSCISAFLQKQKQEVTSKLIKLKGDQLTSLRESKRSITENIKKANQFLNIANSIDEKKKGQINLAALLDDAKLILAQPWYLFNDSSEKALEIIVNTSVVESLEKFITLEEKGTLVYKLLTTEQLTLRQMEVPPPPKHIVYAPELVKDVRETGKRVPSEKSKNPTLIKDVPSYRRKTGSYASLNSSRSSSSNDCGAQNEPKYYRKVSGNEEYKQPTSYQSIQLMPLRQGDQDLVYVSHIVDPHNFFVQRASHQPVVNELIREFRNAKTMPRVNPDYVTEGKTYLVYVKADNLWHRCVVTDVRHDQHKANITVFCIDFGSTETVNIEKLRLIPSVRIQNPPPLAINCSLDSCQPINGSWMSDDALLIQNIIDNKQAVLHVLSEGKTRASVELTSYEHGVSVAHALAFHGRARLLPHTKYPDTLLLKDKCKIFTNTNEFSPGSKHEVYITAITNPDKFYIRMSNLQKVFEKMCDDLDAEYKLNDTTGRIYLPEKKTVCAANVERCGYEGDATTDKRVRWMRALILELPGRARVRVLLLDSGETLLLHWSALRRLPQKFCNQNAMSARCHLAGVTPLNKKWNARSVNLLSTFKGRTLQLLVEGERTRDSVGVTLYDEQPSNEEPVCINQLMIQHHFAVPFGMFMFNNQTETADMVKTNKPILPFEDKEPKPKSKQRNVILLKNANNVLAEKSHDLVAKDKGPIRLEVKILNYQSPSLFYITTIHQQKIYDELYEKIQEYYTKKSTEGRENWNVGDRCCTYSAQSHTWRRATILEQTDDKVKVFYSDFAVVETVPISSLRNLAAELSSIGDGAIMCHLSGVVPAVGQEWPTLTKEFLKELLDAYQRIFITRIGKFKGKSMPIQLWVYHTTQGGALEPNVSEWRCLNEKIVEQGLGVPDKTEQVEDINMSKKVDEDTISFLNLTGSITDWLQTETMPLKPLKLHSETDGDSPCSMLLELDDATTNDNSQDTNTVFVSDWLPAEPLPDNDFTAVPTYIDNCGVIYLHDKTQQDTLILIRKALDVRFKNPDRKAKFTKWTVGEPCVALYYLDHNFYRGRVLEVNAEASTCVVHYVDYGNEETCSFENLRKSIALYQIPVQAHKCILDRIRPVDVNWDRQTLDYVHKAIVEKECLVRVTGEPINYVVPIELRYEKLSINDHLVDFEMAKYTDGSHAKVQKFVGEKVVKTRHPEVLVESISSPECILEVEKEYSSESESSDDGSIMDVYEMCRNKNWNEIIDEDERDSQTGRFITYPKFRDVEFTCDINVINEIDKLELTVVCNQEIQLEYKNMFDKIQKEICDTKPLDGIYENKACLALYPEDNLWYRAVILQYSEAKAQIKVKFVDYGNICIVSLCDVKEISEEYVKLPPLTVTATLHGVKIDPSVTVRNVFEVYETILLDKGHFNVNVIEYKESFPSVELRDEKGTLLNKNLSKDIFLKVN